LAVDVKVLQRSVALLGGLPGAKEVANAGETIQQHLVLNIHQLFSYWIHRLRSIMCHDPPLNSAISYIFTIAEPPLRRCENRGERH
jgi:hypothetical protein